MTSPSSKTRTHPPISYRSDVTGREVAFGRECDQQRGMVRGNHDSACRLVQDRSPTNLRRRRKRSSLPGKIAEIFNAILDQMAQHFTVDRRCEVMTGRR